jgi:hypothetical protein
MLLARRSPLARVAAAGGGGGGGASAGVAGSGMSPSMRANMVSVLSGSGDRGGELPGETLAASDAGRAPRRASVSRKLLLGKIIERAPRAAA